MARYSAAHKEKSRAAIQQAAASLFRQRGYDGVGIDEVCQAAGLTRGTFYAHFKSKRALFEAVMEGPHDFIRRLADRNARSPERLLQQGAKVAREYLHPPNRPGVMRGCSLATLAMDTVRGGDDAKQAYARTVDHIVSELRRENPGLDEKRAQAALALCVGGLLVSAACGDNDTADQVSRAAQREVTNLLNGQSP